MRLRTASLVPCFLLAFSAAAAHGQSLYWEQPQVLAPPALSSSTSAAGSTFLVAAWQEIQRKSAADPTNGDIFLSLATSADGISWTTHPRFFGPVHSTGLIPGNEPRVYSMVVDSHDRILVAVATSERQTLILQSTDKGASFQRLQSIAPSVSTGVPNLFTTAGGGLLLLLSQGSSDGGALGSVSLVYSRSQDGRSWSALAPLVAPGAAVGNPQLQPSHAVWKGRDYLAFEAREIRSDLTSTWQVYVTQSTDDGATWGAPVALTDSKDAIGGRAPFGADPLAFENERPRLYPLSSGLSVAWERSPFGTNTSQIWLARLTDGGSLAALPEIPASDAPAHFAQVMQVRGTQYMLYSDGTKNPARATLLSRTGDGAWQSQLMNNTDPNQGALFPHAVVYRGSIYIFWENQSADTPDALVLLRPLASVGAPLLRPVDFAAGQVTNRDTVTVSWTEPQPVDPSGIREYRYTWTYSDGTTTVEKERQAVSPLTITGKTMFSTRKLDRDGTWTFSIVAEDIAGNVTATPATVSFTRDATPPMAVSFQVVGADGSPLFDLPPTAPTRRGATAYSPPSNTFTVRWIPGPDKDVVGYTYNLQQGWATLADYEQSTVPLLTPPNRVVTTATELTFDNRDNGVYVLTVQALDRAGNLSPASTIAMGLDHYRIVTRVDYLEPPVPDALGNVPVTIHGRGFVENGRITKVILDRGHRAPPWDIEIDPASLKITDRLIAGITMDTTRDPGEYRVGLLQDRPSGETVLYFAPIRFSFEPAGTVKIGNFQVLLPTWVAGPSPQYLFSLNGLVVLLVVALLAVIGILAFRKVISLAQEGALVRTEVLALLQGRPNPRWEERKRRMQELKRRGIGLRLKFTLLMGVLATIIVLIVSIPLGFQMVSRQRISLATGMQNSANILMGALSSSAQILFQQQEQGLFGAVGMASLRSTMPEAVYTTITGPDVRFRPTDPKDAVWDSDEKHFTDELNAGTFKRAQESVGDELSRTVIPDLQKRVDSDAAARLQPLIDQFRTLRGQLAALQGKTDPASRNQRTEASAKLDRVSRDINAQARSLFAVAGTLEPFDPGKRLRPTYLFYRPVVFYRPDPQVANDTFYQGMIRLQVRTDSINRQIDESIRGVIEIAGLIALGAIALGILGAVILANITVTPIRRLASGVARIRDTDDKEQLHDHVIEIKTRDEIRTLADTVNEMTQGLVTAAKANKLLLEGIDVQRRFLPLVKDRSGEPSSTAEEDNPRMEIFGYYKGAKGVSGDYFDFKRLDDTHYAVIKCDVSGKGVAAALIMVEVATLFSTYFKEWPKRKENIVRIKDAAERTRALKELERLEPLVYQINETLDERSFKGRFAALIVCLFNSATGVVAICNAGDTVANKYSAQQKKMVHIQLPSAPAAGTFPNFMVEMKNPFRQVQQELAPGDVLFLNTDGFEESKRPLRGPDLRVLENREEDFTPDRIDAIINAVFNRGRYVLERKENPIPGEELVFDFSSCKGTVREAVLALVSVEKVYRLCPRALPGHEDRVKVEDKVAGFLKEHFLQYTAYFGHPLDGEQKGVLTFTNVSEEDQYDDLTIMALRRK